MGHRLFGDSATASGVRWLLISLVLAAVGDLVLDVPYYFGAFIPGLGGLPGGASYRLYVSVLSVALPTVIGPIGFVGILRIERGRGWTRKWRGERARPALFVAAAAAAFLFASGLALALTRDPVGVIWNSVRMTARFVVVFAGGVYLLDTAARIDPESRSRLATAALVIGTFAAAVRMLTAVYNGLVVSIAPADFVRAQVEPLFSPAAFVLAVFSLFGWVAVYDRILGRLARMQAGRMPHQPSPNARIPPRIHASGSQSGSTRRTKPTTRNARVERPRELPITMRASGRRSTLNWALYSWIPAFGRVASRNSCKASPCAPYEVPPTIVMPIEARSTPSATIGIMMTARSRRMLDASEVGRRSRSEPCAKRDFDMDSGM